MPSGRPSGVAAAALPRCGSSGLLSLRAAWVVASGPACAYIIILWWRLAVWPWSGLPSSAPVVCRSAPGAVLRIGWACCPAGLLLLWSGVVAWPDPGRPVVCRSGDRVASVPAVALAASAPRASGLAAVAPLRSWAFGPRFVWRCRRSSGPVRPGGRCLYAFCRLAVAPSGPGRVASGAASLRSASLRIVRSSSSGCLAVGRRPVRSALICCRGSDRSGRGPRSAWRLAVVALPRVRPSCRLPPLQDGPGRLSGSGPGRSGPLQLSPQLSCNPVQFRPAFCGNFPCNFHAMPCNIFCKVRGRRPPKVSLDFITI